MLTFFFFFLKTKLDNKLTIKTIIKIYEHLKAQEHQLALSCDTAWDVSKCKGGVGWVLGDHSSALIAAGEICVKLL